MEAEEEKTPTGIWAMFMFHDSRKVGMGLWHYCFSTLFYFLHALPSYAPGFSEYSGDKYQINVTLAIGLVGAGTLLDAWLDKFKAPPVVKAATDAAAFLLVAWAILGPWGV